MGFWSKILGYEEEEEAEITEVTKSPGRMTYTQPMERKASQRMFVKVVIIYPQAYSDCKHIADELKAGRNVIVCYERTDSQTALQVQTFMEGFCYARKDRMEKVSERTFAFITE